MDFRQPRLWRLLGLCIGLVLLVGIAAAAVPLVGLPPVKDWLKKSGPETTPTNESASAAELVTGSTETLRLPDEVARRLGVHTAPVKTADALRPLELTGSLNWDVNRLAPVRSRFPGEVVEIATVEPESTHLAAAGVKPRELRYGDRVQKGQLLAVVWNADLGNKKSELIDNLSLLAMHRPVLDRLERLQEQGVATPAQVEAANRDAETDKIKIAAAERTLRSWRVPEEEIQAIHDEARRLADKKAKRDAEKEKGWARVEIRAPFDGVIVERSVNTHNIVDTATDLFKISDLDHLTVWAQAYEEDLPALRALRPDRRRWQIRLQSEPNAKPSPGTIDVIGYAVDPNQHTAVVTGQVDNPKDPASGEYRLRVGQFITATIELPPPEGEVVIPTTALVDDGRESIVFVQPDANQRVFRQRRVAVTRREEKAVYVKTVPTPEEEKAGIEGLKPGEQVVTNGNIELKAALEDLQSAKPK